MLAHCQVIRLGQKLPHFRFKRLLTRVEHAHQEHSAIHWVRHYLIQGSEVVVARVLAADRRAVSAGRKRGFTEEPAKRVLPDADVQAKDRRAVEIGELVIEIIRHQRHKRKPMIWGNVPIWVVEEEAVARIGHYIHALKCPSDILAGLRFIHGYWSFPDYFPLITSLLYNTHSQLETQTTCSVCDGYRQCHIQAPVPRSHGREQREYLEKSLNALEGFT